MNVVETLNSARVDIAVGASLNNALAEDKTTVNSLNQLAMSLHNCPHVDHQKVSEYMKRRRDQVNNSDPLSNDGIRCHVIGSIDRVIFERENTDPVSEVPILIANGLPRIGSFSPLSFVKHGPAVIKHWYLNSVKIMLDPQNLDQLSNLPSTFISCDALKSVQSLSINVREPDDYDTDSNLDSQKTELDKIMRSIFRGYNTIGNLKRLHIGEIFSADLQDDFVLSINGTDRLKTVSALWVTFHGTNRKITELINAKDMPALTDLTICKANFAKITDQLKESGVLQKLTALRLSECDITDEELDVLLSMIPNLKHLVVSKNFCTLDLMRFKDRELKELDELAILGTEITNLADFFATSTARQLRVINFDQWNTWKLEEQYSREKATMNEFLRNLSSTEYPKFERLRVLNFSGFGDMSEVLGKLPSSDAFSEVRVLSIDQIPETAESQRLLKTLINYFSNLFAISALFEPSKYAVSSEMRLACQQHPNLISARFGTGSTHIAVGDVSAQTVRGVIDSNGPGPYWFSPVNGYIYSLHG